MTSEPEQPSPEQPPRRRGEPRPDLLAPEMTPLEELPPPPGFAGGPPEQPSVLGSPYVLAGLAIVAAIFLAVAFVVVFGSRGGGGDGFIVGPGGGSAVPGGQQARSIAISTVREGPSSEFLEIGTLRSSQDIEVTGRNADSTWFQIVFPPQSILRGWVPASALRMADGVADSLAVVATTPIPRATIAVPTATTDPSTATPTPTTTATATVTSAPDLALVGCVPGSPLVATVRNAGAVALQNRTVRITTTSTSGTGSADHTVNLEPGATINLATNQITQSPSTTVQVVLIGSPGDGNPANNVITCVSSVTPGNVPPPITGSTPTVIFVTPSPTP